MCFTSEGGQVFDLPSERSRTERKWNATPLFSCRGAACRRPLFARYGRPQGTPLHERDVGCFHSCLFVSIRGSTELLPALLLRLEGGSETAPYFEAIARRTPCWSEI